jgi:hypothetical protein
MKKNFKLKALILLVVLAMTSGCIKVETGMKISLTKDVESFYVMAMMDQMMGQEGASTDSFKGNSKKLEEEGYKVSDYKEDGYTGIKATKSLGNLDDLSYEGEVRVVNLDKVDENTKYFKVEKGFLKNTYTAKFTTTVNNDIMDELENQQKGQEQPTNPDEELIEETEVETMVDEVNDNNVPETPKEDGKVDETPVDDTTGETPKDDTTVPPTESETPIEGETPTTDENNIIDDDSLDQIKKMMNVNYRVEVPIKAISSNATKTSEDGKVLEWNLMDWKEGSTIEFKFEAWNIMNLLIVAGGALLILVILIIMFVVSRKAKKKAEPAPLAEQPIAEVNDEKASSITPVNPTETPALKPVGEATEVKEGPVTLDVPTEAVPAPVPETPAIPEVAMETPVAPVTVEVPKIVTTPEITPAAPAEPEEAKTE